LISNQLTGGRGREEKAAFRRERGDREKAKERRVEKEPR
jgi:hypothetical protein